MNAMPVNAFRALWDLGYRRLLCVTPHDCGLREAGKRPGIKAGDRWEGRGSKTFDATEADLDRWHAMGGGVGIRCDGTFIAIDVDSLSPEWSPRIVALARECLGPAPIRFGREPKALLVYRAVDAISYQATRFDDGMDPKKPGLVECLSGAEDTKWFVAHGVHPVTRHPYRWPAGVPHADELSTVSQAQITAFFGRLDQELPKAKSTKLTERVRGAIDQRALVAEDPDLIERAMRSIRNDPAVFGYAEWVRFAVALRASFPNDPARALGLFEDFTERAEIDEPTERPDRVFWSLTPPFSIGAPFIASMAERHGNGSFGAQEFWFQEEPDPSEASQIFAEVELNASKKNAADAVEPIKWVRPSEWAGVEPPEREWDVVGWVPRYEVTLLYGDGGIGKTLAIHQLATAMAAGVPWLGQETRQRRVMCFFCEDSEDELLRRQVDINHALGVGWDAIDDRLRIASRKYMDNLLALWDRNTGAMKRSAVWQQLRDDAVAFGAEVLIVDTIADTHGGSEIDRGQVNAFVKSCLGRLAKEIDGSVIALGHPSMSGKSSGSGTSGSTAWSNAVRSRMYLRYPKGVEKGNVRELEGMKLNYGPKGNLLKLRWQAGAFVLVASSKPADVAGAEASAALMAGASIEDVARAAVLDALRRCAGERMSLAPTSANYAPRVLKRIEPELLETLSTDEVEAALRRLEKEGAIIAGKVGTDEWRRAVQGIIVRDILSADTGIFG